LVVDLNRAPTDESLVPGISDSVLIPGNLGLSEAEKHTRIEALFDPYHAEIDRQIETLARPGQRPAFLAIHSFTPHFHRLRRPWHVGILWDKDPRLAVPMLQYLRGLAGVCVGDNEPYSGRHPADYSIDHHAEPRGLAHVGIEIRQDLIRDEQGQTLWAGHIGDALDFALRHCAAFEPFSGRRAA
jgi:predicted N-formylglutamate amidohydrolase